VKPDATAPWWEAAVIYQIYLRSFTDSDGDGVGDLPGLISRLPYVASLGFEGIWLTPFQPSPQADQGYDVSDYCAVDPLFGTMDDFDRLIDRAHGLGVRVVVDLVPNHCSADHPRFVEALESQPGSAARELFHFADGRGKHGEQPPNNWQSVFGGPAWERAVPGSASDRQWYLHLYTAAQPDWNWRNPVVIDYFDDVVRFWLERGADGLRIDVAHGLYKAQDMPDLVDAVTVMDGLRTNAHICDQEEVHAIYRRWRAIAGDYRPRRLLVGEVNLEPRRAWRYTRPDELHQTFAFAFLRAGWDPHAWVATGGKLEEAQRLSGAPTSWALENHDVERTPKRFGDGPRGSARARAALLAMLGLPGSAYVYQGQELGLTEVDVPEYHRVDPAWARGGLCRDGARVPLPWTADALQAYGFSPRAAAAEPWLPFPVGWGEQCVEHQQGDPASMLGLLRQALALRKELHSEGILAARDTPSWRQDEGGLVVCDRPQLSIAVVMGDEPVRQPPGELLISSHPQPQPGWLAPDTSAWIERP